MARDCVTIGATFVFNITVSMNGKSCNELTDSSFAKEDGEIDCSMQLCSAHHVTPGGYYISVPNTCKERFR